MIQRRLCCTRVIKIPPRVEPGQAGKTPGPFATNAIWRFRRGGKTPPRDGSRIFRAWRSALRIARIAGMQQTYPPRSAVISWIFFDWAAEPFFTLITTFVFAPYFATHVASDPASGQSLWGFATAAAGLMIALLSPVLGAIADASGRRKPWIAAFGALLVIGSSLMWFGRPGDVGVIPPLLLAYGDRDRRRRIRHRLQQCDDADAGAAGPDRPIVRHRLGHRLCRRHSQPDPGARLSRRQSRDRPHAVRLLAAVRARSRHPSGRSHHRAVDRHLVHHLRAADVPADAGLSRQAAVGAKRCAKD